MEKGIESDIKILTKLDFQVRHRWYSNWIGSKGVKKSMPQAEGNSAVTRNAALGLTQIVIHFRTGSQSLLIYKGLLVTCRQ